MTIKTISLFLLCTISFFLSSNYRLYTVASSRDCNDSVEVKIVVSAADQKIYLTQNNSICFEAKIVIPLCNTNYPSNCGTTTYGTKYPLKYGITSVTNTIYDNSKADRNFYSGSAFDLYRQPDGTVGSIHGVISSEMNGGYIDGKRIGSHGCIRISRETSLYMAKFVANGTEVNIIKSSYAKNQQPQSNLQSSPLSRATQAPAKSRSLIVPRQSIPVTRPINSTQPSDLDRSQDKPATNKPKSNSTICQSIQSEIDRIRSNPKAFVNSENQISNREAKKIANNCS